MFFLSPTHQVQVERQFSANLLKRGFCFLEMNYSATVTAFSFGIASYIALSR